MSKIEAIPAAKNLWSTPHEMIALWETDRNKQRHEVLISTWLYEMGGHAESVADLGCGNGRLASLLHPNTEYFGFDTTIEMIALAKERVTSSEQLNINVHFSLLDIFESSMQDFDSIVLQDVAYHQTNPIGAVLRITSLWSAKRYIFSLLVGDIREELLSSVVVPFTDLFRLQEYLEFTRVYIEQLVPENFAWVLVEARKKA